MSELAKQRLVIDKVDKQLAEAFNERFAAVKVILNYKLENNLPIYNPQREKEMIEKELELIKDEQLKKYYRLFLTNLLSLSKQYQEELKNDSGK